MPFVEFKGVSKIKLSSLARFVKPVQQQFELSIEEKNIR